MFWEMVAKMMEKRNISQAHLSKFIGKEKSQVNKWMLRGTIPPADYALKIAKLFNTTVEHLLTGDAPETRVSDQRRRFMNWIDDMTEAEMEAIQQLFKMIGAYGEKLSGDNPSIKFKADEAIGRDDSILSIAESSQEYKKT